MPGNADRSHRKVFIGGLNYNSTEESLKSHFSKFGELVDVVVMKFPDTQRSRGFGFVTFSSDEDVDNCQLNRPHTIDGKQVETKRATPRDKLGNCEAGLTVKKIFVGGIKEDAEDEQIKEYFSEFGNVVSVTRMTDKESGKKRGFCFVEFDDYDPVDKAILKSNHEIDGKHVDVKKALSKQDMGIGGGRGGMAKAGGRGRGGFGGPRGGARGRGNFNNGNQWGGPGGWSQGGWPGADQGWGGAPTDEFFQPGAEWGPGPAGGFGG